MRLRLSITAKLTLVFVLFAALLLVGVGVLAYTSGRAALEAATISDLLSAAIEKEAALNAWVEDRRSAIVALAHSPDVLEKVAAFMSRPDPGAHDRLVRSLQTWAGPGQPYLALLVIDAPTGRVIAATDPREEGKFKEDRPYFINGKNGPYVQNIYYSLVLPGPAMTAAAPLRSAEGRLLGVLAGRLNLAALNAIINRRTGLHQTDDAFLANTSNLFVTQPRFISDPAVLRRGIHTEAVKRCLTRTSGVVSAEDYRGVPAITVYRWLPQRQLCLVVKLDQAEALAPAYAFGQTILLIGGLALLASSFVALGLARTITQPVLALQTGAIRWGQGQLEVRLPETSGDELGRLAREFNTMAAALSEKEAQLRRYTEELEQIIEERTAALRQSETTFRLLFANHPHPMWVYDLQTLQFLEVNEAAIDHYGYSRHEFLSLRLTDIRPAEDVPLLLENLQQERPALQRSGQWRHRLKDGRIIEVEITSHTLEFAGRKAALVVALDVTERKRAEEALRQSEERTRLIVESALDAVITINSDSTITGWNAQAEAIFGWSRQEALGQSLDIILPAQHRAAHYRGIKHFLATGEGPILNRRIELSARRRDGVEFPIELAISAMRMGDSFIFNAFIRDITERKQAEAEIKRTTAELFFLNDLVMQTTQPMSVADLQGRFVRFNRAFEKLTGYGEDELHRLTYQELTPERWHDMEAQLIAQLLATGQAVRFEKEYRRKDGGLVPVELVVELYRDAAGEPKYMYGFATDITERKQAEQVLQESESRFRQLAESLPQLVWTCEPDGPCDYLSQNWIAYTGIPEAEQLGFGWLAQLHPDDREPAISAWNAAVASGSDFQAEFRIRRHDGVYRWFDTRAVRLRDAEGRTVKWFGSNTDITERKQAEQALAFLAEASKVLASSLDYQITLAAVAHLAVPNFADWCAVDVVEEDGRLNRVAVAHIDPNKVELAHELQRRTPFDPDAPRGLANVLRTGQPELYPELSDALLEASIPDPEVLAIARQLGLRSAMVVPLQAHEQALGVITLVWAESGRSYEAGDLALAEELARRAALAIDNARLYREAQRMNVELEERVRERTIRLEAANKELEAFAYSVSHDLRAPLRSIDGFSQALLEDYADRLDAEGQRYLQRVRVSSQRMAGLIDDLLALSRLSRSEMHRETVNLTALVQAIAAGLQEAEPARQVEFRIAEGVEVNADEQLMQVALENLLGNAWKFTARQPRPCIEFGTMSQNGQTVYFVRDNGAGFDMAYAGKLFGAFQRLHTAAEFSGTGVGLATVQRIIHRHGGRIWAEGAVDKGATFYFTL